jgi:hypothetical protein
VISELVGKGVLLTVLRSPGVAEAGGAVAAVTTAVASRLPQASSRTLARPGRESAVDDKQSSNPRKLEAVPASTCAECLEHDVAVRREKRPAVTTGNESHTYRGVHRD